MATTKTAKKPAAKKTNSTGNRYPEDFKKKVVDFVESAGRGGMTEAQAKFNVSYIALRSWMNRFGKNAKPAEVKGSAKASAAKLPKSGKDSNGSNYFKQIFADMELEIDNARTEHNATMTKLINDHNVVLARLSEKLKETKRFFGMNG